MKKKYIVYLLIMLTGGSSFALNNKTNNLRTRIEKKEIVVVNGKEIIYKTSTLKPVMKIEESIYIKNNDVRKEAFNTLYSFNLDKKTVLYGNLNKYNKNYVVTYSNNKGESYSSFPIKKNGKAISLKDYTNVRFIINEIKPLEEKEMIIRYTYNYFN